LAACGRRIALQQAPHPRRRLRSIALQQVPRSKRRQRAHGRGAKTQRAWRQAGGALFFSLQQATHPRRILRLIARQHGAAPDQNRRAARAVRGSAREAKPTFGSHQKTRVFSCVPLFCIHLVSVFNSLCCLFIWCVILFAVL
jgi:hypothetical protein